MQSIKKNDEFYQILSPNSKDDGVWIHQNAWFSLGEFSCDKKVNYELNSTQNGVYAFVIEGKATIQNHLLNNFQGLYQQLLYLK